MQWTLNLPWQGNILHLRLSLLCPAQGGSKQILQRSCIPSPQVAVQAAQSVHVSHPEMNNKQVIT